jgi:methylated-DNA-[protein]-cysteine S-methyltransferase
VGTIKLFATDGALIAIIWESEKPQQPDLDTAKLDPSHPILREAERQLNEYFAGARTEFDLPLEPRGSEFQTRVWCALREIPFGETRSYLDLAQMIGAPKACRAVGAANGKNPLPIVIPCHRVIGKDGTLTGFGGGLENKATLLALEARGATSAAR